MAAGSTPLERLLELLENVTHRNGYIIALCPAHDDNSPSLSLAEGDDGRVLINCFAGCPPEKIVQAVGLKMADLFPSSTKKGGGRFFIPPTKSKYVNTQGESGEGITLSAYSQAKQLPKRFLERFGVTEVANYRDHPAVRFAYLGTDGDELCVRFRVSLDGKPKVRTRSKDKHYLYGLWLLERFEEKRYAILCEGESDTQTLWLHGFPGLGVPGSKSWQSSWAEHLSAFERIYVLVEPDESGEGLWDRLVASDLIRERLYRVTLGEFDDASGMYLALGEKGFRRQLKDALSRGVSYMDLAESELQERRRELWALCEDLAREERILDHLADDLQASGLAGSTEAGKLLYLALNTRHVHAKQLVNVAVKGPSAAGKSFTVEKILEFYPDSAYYFLTAMSERALAYSAEPLSHRFLILAEAAGMSGDFATYLIRSLLSEGRLCYETVEKTSEGLQPRRIERPGPTGLIVTTTRTSLHSENETRLLTVVVDDSKEHTSQILTTIADEDFEAPDLERWKALQVWIETGASEVTIPYGKRLAGMVPPIAVRLRRDFGAVLNLIRSHALLHRASRERDGRGRVIATLEDYSVVRALIGDLINEVAEATVPAVVRETVDAVGTILEQTGHSSVSIRQVGAALNLEYQPGYRRVKMAEELGYLTNLEDKRGKPARLVLGDPMPRDVDVLPTPGRLAEPLEEDDEGVFTYLRFQGGIKDPPSPQAGTTGSEYRTSFDFGEDTPLAEDEEEL